VATRVGEQVAKSEAILGFVSGSIALAELMKPEIVHGDMTAT
jgi:hypothetical protein